MKDPQPPTPPETRDLSARAAERLAARDLFREANSYVLRTLRRFGVAEIDRDELAQEIVITAFVKLRDYDPGRGAPLQWLHGFTVKFVTNYRRAQRKKRARLTELPLDLPAVAPDAESALGAEQLRRLLLDELLPQLPFELLSVVVAHELEELSFATIAEQQRLPISTVYDRYTRGLAALQSAYKRHQQSRKARGLAVLPFALEQLLAADRHHLTAPPPLVEQAWRRLQRARRWWAPWRALQPFFRHPASHLASTFTGGVLGAVVYAAALPPAPRPPPVVFVQRIAEQQSPDSASSVEPSRAGTVVPSPSAAVLPTDSARGALRQDSNAEQRMFDEAHQAFDRGHFDLALAALAAHERRYPRGAFAAERGILRPRIAQMRAEVPPTP